MMATSRRLALAVLVLAATQGCAWVKKSHLDELRSRANELETLNENQAVNIRTLQERLKELDKDVARWKAMYEDEKAISQKLQDLLTSQRDERTKLQDEITRLAREMGAHTRMTSEGMALVLEQNILFSPGKNTLKEAGKRALAKVVAFLKEKQGVLRIDGHTDSDPIQHSAWENNHHLSCGRALAVFAELRVQGVPENRIHVSGFGPNMPVADNASAAGKQKNRRVELLLIRTPATAVEAEAADAAPEPAPPKVEAVAPAPAPKPKADDKVVPK